MNNRKISALALAGSLALMAVSALPVSAQSMTSTAAVGASMSASTTKSSRKLNTKSQTAADAQIQGRIAALNALETRIGQMTKVSTADQSALDANIQASITDMTNLEAKINADTDNTTLKADIQSITKSYRVYALILPQGRIAAAADRVLTIVGLFQDLSAKLQMRITAAQTAGQNVTTINTWMTDMNTQITNANTLAEAALTEIGSLQPDNGDTTVAASNLAALKDARSKIQSAQADLKTARSDAGSIVKALEAMKITTPSVTPTPTATPTPTPT